MAPKTHHATSITTSGATPSGAKTVTIPVLVISILLTVLIVSALFICVGCITLRSRTRRREYEVTRNEYPSPLPPPLDTPHVIDLRGSFAGSRGDLGVSNAGLLRPERASLSAPGGGVGLGVTHVRGDSMGGSREALLNPGVAAPQTKGVRYA
jgi:hypothetical protein